MFKHVVNPFDGGVCKEAKCKCGLDMLRGRGEFFGVSSHERNKHSTDEEKKNFNTTRNIRSARKDQLKSLLSLVAKRHHQINTEANTNHKSLHTPFLNNEMVYGYYCSTCNVLVRKKSNHVRKRKPTDDASSITSSGTCLGGVDNTNGMEDSDDDVSNNGSRAAMSIAFGEPGPTATAPESTANGNCLISKIRCYSVKITNKLTPSTFDFKTIDARNVRKSYWSLWHRTIYHGVVAASTVASAPAPTQDASVVSRMLRFEMQTMNEQMSLQLRNGIIVGDALGRMDQTKVDNNSNSPSADLSNLANMLAMHSGDPPDDLLTSSNNRDAIDRPLLRELEQYLPRDENLHVLVDFLTSLNFENIACNNFDGSHAKMFKWMTVRTAKATTDGDQRRWEEGTQSLIQECYKHATNAVLRFNPLQLNQIMGVGDVRKSELADKVKESLTQSDNLSNHEDVVSCASSAEARDFVISVLEYLNKDKDRASRKFKPLLEGALNKCSRVWVKLVLCLGRRCEEDTSNVEAWNRMFKPRLEQCAIELQASKDNDEAVVSDDTKSKAICAVNFLMLSALNITTAQSYKDRVQKGLSVIGMFVRSCAVTLESTESAGYGVVITEPHVSVNSPASAHTAVSACLYILRLVHIASMYHASENDDVAMQQHLNNIQSLTNNLTILDIANVATTTMPYETKVKKNIWRCIPIIANEEFGTVPNSLMTTKDDISDSITVTQDRMASANRMVLRSYNDSVKELLTKAHQIARANYSTMTIEDDNNIWHMQNDSLNLLIEMITNSTPSLTKASQETNLLSSYVGDNAYCSLMSAKYTLNGKTITSSELTNMLCCAIKSSNDFATTFDQLSRSMLCDMMFLLRQSSFGQPRTNEFNELICGVTNAYAAFEFKSGLHPTVVDGDSTKSCHLMASAPEHWNFFFFLCATLILFWCKFCSL